MQVGSSHHLLSACFKAEIDKSCFGKLGLFFSNLILADLYQFFRQNPERHEYTFRGLCGEVRTKLGIYQTEEDRIFADLMHVPAPELLLRKCHPDILPNYGSDCEGCKCIFIRSTNHNQKIFNV